MAIIIQDTNDIYDMAQDLLDGDEFQSDEAALRAMNLAYFKILAERDWYFLEKSYAMSLSDLSLALITDMMEVLRVWYVDANGKVSHQLMRAPYSDRFNTEYDYYIDTNTNMLVLINTLNTGSLLIDYKYSPLALAFEDVTDVSTVTPVIPRTYRGLLAYALVKAFKKGDEADEMYKENLVDEELLYNAMIDDDNKHKEFYA